MYLGFMGTRKLRRSALAVVGAACLVLGCGGSSASSAPGAAGSAGNTGSALMGSAGNAGSALAGGAAGSQSSNAAAGSAAVAQAGAGSAWGAAGSGGSNSAPSGGTAGANAIDFSHGSRLLIPQRNLSAVALGPTGDFHDLTSLDNIDVTVASVLADAPIYPRQFAVTFDMSGLFISNCQFWSGKFEVSSLAVKQDVSGSGGHLKIEQVDGHYILTHDGPGTHQLRVTGTFRATLSQDGGGYCPSLPMGEVAVPVAFTTNIDIQRMASVKAAPSGCGPAPVMLSGRNYPGTWINILNDAGEPMVANNVDDTYPIDVLVETEKPAQIAEAGSGLSYNGLIVTGEPQRVRLSTAYGTLFTYQLLDTSFVDGLEVQFSARQSQDVKSPRYPLPTDVTPAVALGKVLVADATLEVGGVKLCSPILASDFKTTILSPSVCNVQPEAAPDQYPGIPGFLATFVDPTGTCELELSVPGANGGQKLATQLSAVLSGGKF